MPPFLLQLLFLVRGRRATCRPVHCIDDFAQVASEPREPPRKRVRAEQFVVIACGGPGVGELREQSQVVAHLDQVQVGGFGKDKHGGGLGNLRINPRLP